MRVADPDDSRHFDVGGYLRNWTVEAARDAIAAYAHIPIALLYDPDPAIREAAAYALAAASGRAGEISAALHERLRIEDDARVRAGLALAIAQLAHEHDPGDTAAFARALWSDPTGPGSHRIGQEGCTSPPRVTRPRAVARPERSRAPVRQLAPSATAETTSPWWSNNGDTSR